MRDMANHKKEEEEFPAMHPDHPCPSKWDEGEVCGVLFKASELIRYLPGPTLGKHVEANVCTSQSGEKIGGHHPVLYFSTQLTKKYSPAIC